MSTDGIDFDALYRELGDDIRKALGRYGDHRVPVEDGLNEVFRIALEELPPGIPAKAWFLKTAFNVAYNWRHRVRFTYELPGVLADAADDASPEDWLILKETRIRVRRVIDSLAPELREVFVLAKLEEIPLPDIAAALGLTLSTVRSRLERAKEAFMKEGRRRHVEGVLGVVPVLVDATADSLRATVDRWLRYAGSAAVGGAVVAAWFLSRQPPAQIPIHAERPTVAQTRWAVVPAPPVTEPPQDAVPDLAPGTLLPQPSSPDPDETARDELKLYRRGLNAYNHGQYGEALQYLDLHKALYSNGTTAPLRDNLILRIKSLTAG
jgi:RNA polymerase sigma-70 factor (ECF subfamily)